MHHVLDAHACLLNGCGRPAQYVDLIHGIYSLFGETGIVLLFMLSSIKSMPPGLVGRPPPPFPPLKFIVRFLIIIQTINL